MRQIDRIFSGQAAPPFALLDRREARADEQRRALSSGCPCIISFSLNIPGPVKQFPFAKKTFEVGEAALFDRFGESLSPWSRLNAVTGNEGIYLCQLPAVEAKRIAVALEDSHPLGRLFDLDILSTYGHISRVSLGTPPRKCLLCEKEAAVCGRNRAHSIQELRSHVADLMEAYFADAAADLISDCAQEAMLIEVSVTPKPGLVDQHDAGAHTDMDEHTFHRSAVELRGWLKKMYLIGRDHPEETPETVFSLLRETGLQAEKAMFRVTNGINTHKGLLFSLALLCSAAGKLQAETDRCFSLAEWTQEAALLGRCSLTDLSPNSDLMHMPAPIYASDAYGARGESSAAFPSVTKAALPVFLTTYEQSRSLNYAAARTLLTLISMIEDTNVIRRAGREMALFRRQQAAEILCRLTQNNYTILLSDLNREYIADNISPGGCADLLAITLFMHLLLQRSILCL